MTSIKIHMMSVQTFGQIVAMLMICTYHLVQTTKSTSCSQDEI